MIIPSGTAKRQMNQAAYKHESLFDTLIKQALVGEDIGNDLDIPQQPMPEEKEPSVPQDLQQTMMQSNNTGIGQQQQQDPSSKHKDFSIIANELSEFLQKSKALSANYILVDQKREQKTGRWVFVIEPAEQPELQTGPVVNKGGEPFQGGPKITNTV
jgi:hypothetical protein